MSDCPAITGWPQDPSNVCTHGGACLSDTLCVCAGDWTGVGDFVLNQPTCDVNIIYVRVAWSLTACLNFVMSLFAAYFLFHAIWFNESVWRNRKLRRRKTIFGLTCLASSTSITIVGVMRAASPTTTAIGTHPASTVFFALGSGGFWIASLQFLYVFLQVSISQARFKARAKESMNQMVKSLAIGLPLVGVIVVVAQICVLSMLAAQSREAMYALGLVHYVLLSLCMLILGAWLIPRFVDPLVRDLVESAESSGPPQSPARMLQSSNVKVKHLLAKLRRFRVELRNQNLVNLPLGFLFGCWPWLQTQSAYFLPVPYMTTAILLGLGLYLELPVHDAVSSSAGHQRIVADSQKSSGGTAQSTTYAGGALSVNPIIFSAAQRSDDEPGVSMGGSRVESGPT